MEFVPNKLTDAELAAAFEFAWDWSLLNHVEIVQWADAQLACRDEIPIWLINLSTMKQPDRAPFATRLIEDIELNPSTRAGFALATLIPDPIEWRANDVPSWLLVILRLAYRFCSPVHPFVIESNIMFTRFDWWEPSDVVPIGDSERAEFRTLLAKYRNAELAHDFGSLRLRLGAGARLSSE